MKPLYFVPILAVLGLSLSVHADSREDTLQTWIDYVHEYRQYMEDYRQWAADRFERYENRIAERDNQLDAKDARIQELEEDIQDLNERIQELEEDIHGAEGDSDGLIEDLLDSLTQDPQEIHDMSTDQESYADGDTIHITGRVTPIETSDLVALRIYSPNGNLVIIEQLDISPNGEFHIELLAGGMLWERPGMFTVHTQVGNSQVVETQFDFTPKITPKEKSHITTDRQTYTLDDVILITGQAEMNVYPETTNLKGETTPGSSELQSVWINIGHRDDASYEYHIWCNHTSGIDPYCGWNGGENTPLVDPEYNDDGTFSFGIEIEDHMAIGEYGIYTNVAGSASFTLIPPN